MSGWGEPYPNFVMKDDDKIYNRHSVRLREYDYSQSNAYFITICTYKKQPLLGDIDKGMMIINHFGKIVFEEWSRTSQLRSNITIHPFIVMPNHFHAILTLMDDSSFIGKAIPQKSVGTQLAESRNDDQDYRTIRKFGKPESNSVSSIIGAFKSAVTKRIHWEGYSLSNPIWQSRFYDHIIRNEHEKKLITEYILRNPEFWENDENNPKGIDVIKGFKELERLIIKTKAD